jgi:hypothetical protein
MGLSSLGSTALFFRSKETKTDDAFRGESKNEDGRVCRHRDSISFLPLDFRAGVSINLDHLMRISDQALLRLTSAHDL